MADPTPPTGDNRMSEPVTLTRSQARTLELMFWCDAQLLVQAADRATDPEIRTDYNLAAEQCQKSAQLLAAAYMDGLDYDARMDFLAAHADAVGGPGGEAALIALVSS